MKKLYHEHEFYAAVMNEDLGRIEDLTKKYGSNFSMAQNTANGDLWKVKKKVSLPSKMSHGQNVDNFSLKSRLMTAFFSF